MKVEIVFTEHCTYSATIEVPDTAPKEPQALAEWLHEFTDEGCCFERWFDIVEQQHPRWYEGNGCRIEVNERMLDDQVRILAKGKQ
jgi:hypothetical protein